MQNKNNYCYGYLTQFNHKKGFGRIKSDKGLVQVTRASLFNAGINKIDVEELQHHKLKFKTIFDPIGKLRAVNIQLEKGTLS